MGRVINPMGEPLDGLGNIHAEAHRDVEFPAPGVVDRAPIDQPLNTGVLNIDTTIPIGRGQRELVIGDRKTGKTRTMLDIISNQKGQHVHCIYVGIGIQAAKAKAAVQLLQKRGVLNFTTFVIAHSDDPPPIQYIAPYVGAAIGEYYMYQGKHALIIFDDLSKQAKAYRQVSLLLKRSPGRDAYPGDIFFLHSRLLERASQLTAKLGGGSMTALPVAETQVGDISDYIITNLMSITDGHIYLDANMMHEGILPAINSGASVSRIGGKVQTPMLRKVGELAGRILARYSEVRSFETINTEVLKIPCEISAGANVSGKFFLKIRKWPLKMTSKLSYYH
jgi:F-type H+/Na+-transporting ATPase subunit alpha